MKKNDYFSYTISLIVSLTILYLTFFIIDSNFITTNRYLLKIPNDIIYIHNDGSQEIEKFIVTEEAKGNILTTQYDQYIIENEKTKYRIINVENDTLNNFPLIGYGQDGVLNNIKCVEGQIFNSEMNNSSKYTLIDEQTKEKLFGSEKTVINKDIMLPDKMGVYDEYKIIGVYENIDENSEAKQLNFIKLNDFSSGIATTLIIKGELPIINNMYSYLKNDLNYNVVSSYVEKLIVNDEYNRMIVIKILLGLIVSIILFMTLYSSISMIIYKKEKIIAIKLAIGANEIDILKEELYPLTKYLFLSIIISLMLSITIIYTYSFFSEHFSVYLTLMSVIVSNIIVLIYFIWIVLILFNNIFKINIIEILKNE